MAGTFPTRKGKPTELLKSSGGLRDFQAKKAGKTGAYAYDVSG